MLPVNHPCDTARLSFWIWVELFHFHIKSCANLNLVLQLFPFLPLPFPLFVQKWQMAQDLSQATVAVISNCATKTLSLLGSAQLHP